MPKCFQGLGSAHSRQNPFSGPTPWTQKTGRKLGREEKGTCKKTLVVLGAGAITAVLRTRQAVCQPVPQPAEVLLQMSDTLQVSSVLQPSAELIRSTWPSWPMDQLCTAYLLGYSRTLKARSLSGRDALPKCFPALSVRHKAVE